MGSTNTRWSLVIGLIVTGCVSGEERPFRKIVRTMPDYAMTMDHGMDADVSVIADAHVDPEPMAASRELWLVVDTQDPIQGFRAQLQPPHAASQQVDEVIAAVGPSAVLIVWDGPGTPRDQTLTQFLTAGVSVVPYYVGSPTVAAGGVAGQDAMRADLRILAAQHLTHPNALKLDGQSVLAVDWTGAVADQFEAVKTTLEATGLAVALAGQVEADSALKDRLRVSWSGCGESDGEVPADRTVRGMMRRFAPCGATVRGRPGSESRFARNVYRARQRADASHGILVVDGVGRWRDDRQIDPVSGEVTTEPASLTGGRTINSYGRARVEIVRRLRQSAEYWRVDLDLGAPTYLLGHGRVDFSLAEDRMSWVLWPDTEAVEVVLNQGPLAVPMGAALAIDGLSPLLSLRLVFGDGESMSWAPTEGPSDWRELAPNGPRRIEEVLLSYSGGVAETAIELRGLRLRAWSDEL